MREISEDTSPVQSVYVAHSDSEIALLLSRLVDKLDKFVECLQTLTEDVHKIVTLLDDKFQSE